MSDSESSSSSSSSDNESSSSSSSENEIKEKKKVLFQDESSDEEEVEFKVNEKFAKQYEDKKNKNLTTSAATNAEEDEDSEDDNAKFDSKKMNDGFLTLLPLIAKKRYDILKNEKVKFFNKGTESDSDEDDEDDEEQSDDEFNSSTATKKTPFTIKDYQRNKITKTMDNDQFQESDEEEGNGKDEDFDSLPHNKQQEKLKKEFIEASNRQLNDDGIGEENSDSDDDGLLVKRKKSTQDQLDEEREFEEFKARLEKKKSPLLAQETETIAEFWKGKDATPDEKFLRDYLLGQKWQSDKGKLPTYEEIMKELDQDEGETTKQDDFERSFNFRYEEPGAAIIVSHSRTIDNSIRRKDSARKTKREKKKERKENRAVQNQEKIKQLKNEKKKEILEKVKEINSITGSSLFNLSSVDIKKIDPEIMVKSIGKKLKQQQQSYDDGEQQQYGGGDEDGGEEYYGDDGQEDGSGGMDLNKLIESGYYDDQFEDDGEVWSNERMSKEREELESMLDKYYEMDYQDLLGDDTPVRFKYTKVDPDTTITIDDILEKEDKDLEKILPLSKIATYYNPSYKGYSEKAEKRYFDQNKNSKYITKSKNTNYNSKYNKTQKPTENNNNNNKQSQQQVQTKQFNKKEEQEQQPKQSYNKPTTTTTTTTTSKPSDTPVVAPGEKKRKSKNKNKLSGKVQKVE